MKKYSTADLRDDFGEGTELYMEFKRSGSNTVTLTDADGNEYKIVVKCDRDRNVTFEEQ